MTEGTFDILRDHPIFCSLDEEQIRSLSKKILHKKFAIGDILIEQGSKQNDLLIIESGSVEIIKVEPHSKQSHRITIVNAGETIGDLSFIDRKPRSASVRALEPTHVFVVPGDSFRSIATKDVYVSICENLAERLRHTDEITVKSLQTELEKTQKIADAGRFVTYILLMLAGYILTTSFLRELVVNIETSMFASLPLIAILGILMFILIKHSKYPYENYGLTFKGSRRALREAIFYSLIFCILLIPVKIVFSDIFYPELNLPVFDWTASLPVVKKDGGAYFQWLGLGLIIYGFFVPLQEFIARGVVQSSLQQLFLEKQNPWIANIIASALFAALHLHISPKLAMIIFFPSLLWGWLYFRSGTLVAPIVSHLIIGWWSIYVLGIERILIPA